MDTKEDSHIPPAGEPAATAPAADPAEAIAEKLQPQMREAPPLPVEKKAKNPRPRRRSRAASREFGAFFDGMLTFLMIVALGLGAVAAHFKHAIEAPGVFAEEGTVLIPPRSGTTDIAEILKRNGFIDDTLAFRVAAYINKARDDLKAGEYVIPKSASIGDIIDILRSGRSIQYAITVPEGLTSLQIVQRLREVDVLAGDIRQIPPEGSLLPDTYRVTRGTSRESLLQAMQRAQKALVDEAWSKRAANLPLRSPQDMVILASIVEKETGKAEERPHVASVFVNRLVKRIRLQSDPTTIYGIAGGKGSLGRGLTRSELDKATPYNTYVIQGLPPTPIANPGKEAIRAVANPAHTGDLYFVADGSGGHVFAETLDQHQRNVARWRNIEKTLDNEDNTPVTAAPAGQPSLPVRQAPNRPSARQNGAAAIR